MGQRGGKRQGSGRKPLALEYKVRDLASPHIPKAIEVVTDIMQNGEKDADRLMAAKLLMAYYFGQPKQQTDVTSNGESVQITIIDHGAKN